MFLTFMISPNISMYLIYIYYQLNYKNNLFCFKKLTPNSSNSFGILARRVSYWVTHKQGGRKARPAPSGRNNTASHKHRPCMYKFSWSHTWKKERTPTTLILILFLIQYSKILSFQCHQFKTLSIGFEFFKFLKPRMYFTLIVHLILN